MNKFLTLIGLSVALAAFPATSANAGDFQPASFLAPSYSALSLSNAVGWTNFAYLSQNNKQGLYQVGTNTAGTGINSFIATNYNLTMFSNSTPLVVNGQQLNGTLIVNTNGTIANNTNLGYQLFLLATNNQPNPFVDFQIPVNADMTDQVTGIGAAGQTNSAFGIVVQTVANTYNTTGTAGAGSNIVNIVFVAVPEGSADLGLVGNVPPPGLGSPYALEPTDGSVSGGWAANTFTMTYTNQTSAVAPTVVVQPFPRYFLNGAKAVRVRAAYSGSSTNAIWLQRLEAFRWKP